MKKRVLFLLLIFSSIMLCCNYNQPNTKEKPVKSRTAMEINLSLGRGINIGNTFEADQSWQSPFVAEDLKKIADLGFTHVRVPIRWGFVMRIIPRAPFEYLFHNSGVSLSCGSLSTSNKRLSG